MDSELIKNLFTGAGLLFLAGNSVSYLSVIAKAYGGYYTGSDEVEANLKEYFNSLKIIGKPLFYLTKVGRVLAYTTLDSIIDAQNQKDHKD